MYVSEKHLKLRVFLCVCVCDAGPLRPLWPALGIIAVTIIVTIFMATSTVVEKISEKQKKSRIGRSGDLNSVGMYAGQCESCCVVL